jgi:hypothetical protein
MQYLRFTNVSSIITAKILQKYKTSKSHPITKFKHQVYNIKTFVNQTNCHAHFTDQQQHHAIMPSSQTTIK